MIDHYFNQYEKIISTRSNPPLQAENSTQVENKTNSAPVSLLRNKQTDPIMIQNETSRQLDEDRSTNAANNTNKLISDLRKKNMNYRYEINSLNLKIDQLLLESKENKVQMSKLLQEREFSTKYIIRLEKVLKSKHSHMSYDEEILNHVQAKLNSFENENKNLKEFKSEVYTIANTCEQINIDVLNYLNDICFFFKDLSELYSKDKTSKQEILFNVRGKSLLD